MKKKIVSYYPYIGSKLNDEVFKNENSWEYHLKKLLEKENIEIHTHDKVAIKEADYVLVFDNLFYRNLDTMWELYEHHKLENSVYINYEPVSGHAKNHDAKGMMHLSKIFNKIITFDDDMIDNKIFIKGNIANFYSKEIPYKNDFKTRNFLTMITNNTNIKSIIETLNKYNSSIYYNQKNIKEDKHSIYREREKAASFFCKKCPKEFDIYGTLWPRKYLKCLKGKVSRDDKIKVLSKYKFAISYDSYTNQNGYISEKIFDCFMAKTVPIYLGANNIDQYIPKGCYIHKNDFKTYKDLYNYLINMDEKTYNQYISNIEKYIHSNNYREDFSSESSARIIKKALLSKRKINYQKAYDSLMYFDKKRKLVKDKSVIYYFLLHKWEDKNKIRVEFTAYKGSNLLIESNGLKDTKAIKVDSFEPFTVDFDYSPKDFYIRIRNENNNYLYQFVSKIPEINHEYGLLLKDHNTTIIYKHYTGMNSIQKIGYVLIHNRNKIWKMIRRNNEEESILL